MTFEYYEKQFRKKASKAGFSEEEIQKCLSYAKILLNNNLPIIYNTSNLAALVGYSKNYIKRAALFTEYFYRKFYVKKSSGKLRMLKEPLPSLKEIQLWILKNILYEIPVSKFAKAYIPKRNILDNVRYHRNKDIVVSLDIRDFFSSIHRSQIENIFFRLGYSSNVSNLLSKLCCCDDVLPQGAPTSPYLSNIFLIDFDNAVSEFCGSINVRYTRYADDLIFSGDFNAAELIDFICEKLQKIDLTLNPAKVKIMEKADRQIVTGIIVNQKIQIPKKQRKFIRQEIYYIEKYGLSDHLIKTKNDRANYLKHLIGKINYALFVNPEDCEMLEYKTFLYTTYFNDN